MKGNAKVLKSLNVLLTEELSAINQYMVHSEMCKDWGFDKLHEEIEKQAMDEMHHAEWLIGRVIFLEGHPNVYKINPFKPGKTPLDMIKMDVDSEADAVKMYNEAIALCARELDNGSKELLDKILSDEEKHVDWADAQIDQVSHMGIQNYLTTLL